MQLCFNCLGRHKVNACSSAGRCSTFQGKRHSHIHFQDSRNSQGSASSTSNGGRGILGANTSVVTQHAASSSVSTRNILLATARVLVVGPKGKSTYVRALLDQGSEASFISESIAQLLGLPKRRTHVPLSGLGASAAGTARSIARVTLRSAVDLGFQVKTEVLVLPRLTSLLPSYEVSKDLAREQFPGVDLADPDFAVPKKIDLILGADLYGQLLRSGVKRSATSQLVAQNTVLGWIVSGPIGAEVTRRAEITASTSPVQAFHCAPQEEVDQVLQRFWALEEVSAPPTKWKPEDERCERVFQDTHTVGIRRADMW